jgi:hypothetical protein
VNCEWYWFEFEWFIRLASEKTEKVVNQRREFSHGHLGASSGVSVLDCLYSGSCNRYGLSDGKQFQGRKRFRGYEELRL